MSQARDLTTSLNALAKLAQFNASKARATARADKSVDWLATKARNEDFNPEVDGCETFVMHDGSLCDWSSITRRYTAKGP